MMMPEAMLGRYVPMLPVEGSAALMWSFWQEFWATGGGSARDAGGW